MSEWITDVSQCEDDKLYWACNKKAHVWSVNGAIAKRLAGDGRHIVAVQEIEKPAPYQPTKPKRREWVLSAESDEYDTDFKCHAFSFSTAIPRCAEHEIHVREVLPTDPTPEAIEEVAEQLESLIEEQEWMLTDADLEIMAAKLRGEQ